MKKRLASGVTFDASAKTVAHADFSDITLAGIQLIVNVTDQIIIYNFADTTKGGTLSTDTLTLEYDTTSMSDTDELMVLVEDGSATQPVSGTFWQATQPVSLASVPSHAVTNAGTFAVQAASTEADGANVTLGAKADAKSTATDTTAITMMQVLKQISASVQAPPSQAVTGTFWQATQPVSGTVTANMGTVTADPFGANADAASATGSISAKLRFIAGTGIPITGTVTVGSHAVTNAGTFAVQNKYSLPLATNTSSTKTLTSASTAYQITIPASPHLVTFCNNSDTDMYWGFATLTSGGIKLAANGGTVTMKCAASVSPYFYCASAGKVLNYTTTVL